MRVFNVEIEKSGHAYPEFLILAHDINHAISLFIDWQDARPDLKIEGFEIQQLPNRKLSDTRRALLELAEAGDVVIAGDLGVAHVDQDAAGRDTSARDAGGFGISRVGFKSERLLPAK